MMLTSDRLYICQTIKVETAVHRHYTGVPAEGLMNLSGRMDRAEAGGRVLVDAGGWNDQGGVGVGAARVPAPPLPPC